MGKSKEIFQDIREKENNDFNPEYFIYSGCTYVTYSNVSTSIHQHVINISSSFEEDKEKIFFDKLKELKKSK